MAPLQRSKELGIVSIEEHRFKRLSELNNLNSIALAQCLIERRRLQIEVLDAWKAVGRDMHRLDHDGNLIREAESDDPKHCGIVFELELGCHGGIQLLSAVKTALQDPS